jgi:hypothetical protein
MHRTISAAVAALGTLVSLLVTVGVVAAPAAHASCPPPDGTSNTTIYKFANKSTTFYPTNIRSDWVYWPHGGTINFTTTSTSEVNASVTATVSAEAGVIFAKASTSLGVTVGGSWSKSATWSYTANVPSGSGYRYRLHMYHFSVNFDVMKKVWSYGSCDYVRAWSRWQHVGHAPAKSNSNVWKLDRRSV